MRALANQARHRNTGYIHECQELATLPYATDGEWECVDEQCAVRLHPCAWNPNEQHKVAPYFRLGPRSEHERDCFVHGLEELAAEGQRRRISSDRGFPVPYPNRIILAPRRVSADNPDDFDAELEATEEPGNGLKTRSGRGSVHDRTFRSIREACWFFTNFPNDRNLKLRVDDCAGTRYDEIFVRIGRESEADIGPRRILYGEMKFIRKPVLSGDTLTITLLDEITFADGRKRERKVKVDMVGWPPHLRNYLWQQVQDALEQARKAHLRNDRDLRPWLFFVGAQEVTKQELFRVSCYPSVAILACRMPPARSKTWCLKPLRAPEPAATSPPLPSRGPVGFSDEAISQGAAPARRSGTEDVTAVVLGQFQNTAPPNLARSAPQPTVTAGSVAGPSAQAVWLPHLRAAARSACSWFLSLFYRDG